MIGTIASLTASIAMAATMATAPVSESNLDGWEYIGEQRITTYCCACNDGAGHESSSGKYLEYGDCACNWLPIGTAVRVGGEEYTVVDICGIDDTIDIFVDDDSGVCQCNHMSYEKVEVMK